MAYLCAENGNLMAIAQQLVQQQQQHQQTQQPQLYPSSSATSHGVWPGTNMMLGVGVGLGMAPWPPVPAWAAADANGSLCGELVGDICSTTSSNSYLTEPNSVLDLSRASLFFSAETHPHPFHEYDALPKQMLPPAPAVPKEGAFRVPDLQAFGGFEESPRNEFMASDWMECLISSEDVVSHGPSLPVSVPACESTESSEIPNAGGARYRHTDESWQSDFGVLGDALRRSYNGGELLGDEMISAASSELLSTKGKVPVMAVHDQAPDFGTVNPKEGKWGQQQQQQQQQQQSKCPESGSKKQDDQKTDDVKKEPDQHPQAVSESGNGSSNCTHLLQSLIECAKIADKDQEAASQTLSRLKALANPFGNPTQRTACYFAEALAKRLSTEKQKEREENSKCLEQSILAYKALNDACPYAKFAHLTANQAILEATEKAEKIHIIDFGIVQGVQWAAILQAFATRSGGKPKKIKITGIPAPSLGPNPEPSLRATGKRLTDFASLLELDFEFCPVLQHMVDICEPFCNLKTEEDECIAVNFMLQLYNLLGESDEALTRVLKLARSLNPRVVTLGEYEANLNNRSFVPRFRSALKYYSAFFESMEPNMSRDCAERANIERLFFGEKITGIVAFEGSERKMRLEGRDQWRQIMQSAGFRCQKLSPYAISQARILLLNYCEGYALDPSTDLLSLAWKDLPLLTVSAWACSDC
eukprot:TRINITY_DN1511_c0_g1_i1.p1 TRINITY_DN1511_c0_g1~~TRINITY_DN1511_c0_g1_i1.p1  ORF type:complete len:703 (+),score=47.66 TRINITY_DN1511_c0_g1_i1:270-2378(+)